ncbi:PadR family transcriptional regulator [Paenibacillus abyssi]|uniref:PadR family transcriptional regulator n=1 Tax=Paenibacillus abyssi TaxID=1340531 RepID=A0A917D6Y3_9BACL|nr:PadR family transcriptional regulator [Paenibacillus abyssi]GGG12502.1 PadR family transcriptional regulator [Paenibacillus abyssi]
MKVSKELLKGSTVILILSMLEQKDMYGYELTKEIEKRSEGIFALKEGTLYPILHTLETDQWVDAYWQEQDGRKRKYYRITAAGKTRLGEKKQEWNVYRNAVERVIGEGYA